MNYMYFSEEEIKSGKLDEFITFLIHKSNGDQGDIEYYYDIRIKPADFNSAEVEWEDVAWSSEWSEGEHWHWIDGEHVVLKEVTFPDNHIEYLPDEDEEEAINTWLKENPGWVKNEFGVWREVENKVKEN